MLALGMVGVNFPLIAFIAVLLPIALGMLLGNLDEDIREFLKPGETLLVPFFAFCLGAGMNFMSFFNPEAVWGGLALGFATVIFTALTGILVYRLFGEKARLDLLQKHQLQGMQWVHLLQSQQQHQWQRGQD